MFLEIWLSGLLSFNFVSFLPSSCSLMGTPGPNSMYYYRVVENTALVHQVSQILGLTSHLSPKESHTITLHCNSAPSIPRLSVRLLKKIAVDTFFILCWVKTL